MKNQEKAQIEEENKVKAEKEKSTKVEPKEIKKPDAAKLVQVAAETSGGFLSGITSFFKTVFSL